MLEVIGTLSGSCFYFRFLTSNLCLQEELPFVSQLIFVLIVQIVAKKQDAQLKLCSSLSSNRHHFYRAQEATNDKEDPISLKTLAL